MRSGSGEGGADQARANRKECGRLSLGRVQHAVATMSLPDLGQITVEACGECLARSNRSSVWVAGLSGPPLGGFADFSYVWHLFSPENFHSWGRLRRVRWGRTRDQ